ncbi:MSHA biogenesis protein MshK [Pseudaeromonas paramecii]|uniref:MSHA biogenesis protein MshK n=1 Tax=Pseudaeromonas paramecii TaxID=2138166 RepID=A0ABP8QPL0_9GAMM
MASVTRMLLGWLLGALCLTQAAETLTDPTRPLQGATEQTAVAKAGLPRLQAIILGQGTHHAILNGQSYHAGQQVAGYKIESIGADAVVLRRGQERHRLVLFSRKVRY